MKARERFEDDVDGVPCPLSTAVCLSMAAPFSHR